MATVKKLQASSLMEVVVAMVILALSITVGLSIFLNVTHSSLTGSRLKAQLLLDQQAIQSQETQQLINGVETIEGLTIVKTVEAYQGVEDLVWLHLEAFNDKEEKLAERNELLWVRED